ncbi:MAG: hypothetical protein M1814_000744 [Vezdaea aestivalis]|nr:MAG: hypothetical protein M1814_000744 [Vezdaea aestivalis]
MISIQSTKPKRENSALNVLPCKIGHDGPVNATKRYWNPTKGNGKCTPSAKDEMVILLTIGRSRTDGNVTSYFRGRKLHAKPVAIPEGYRGVIASATDKIEKFQVHPEVEGENTEADEAFEVKILEETGEFQELMVWGHDTTIDPADDVYIRGVQEWIGLAEKMHAYDDCSSSVDKK